MDFVDRLRAALADRYEIERELGRGGMAVVHLARDLKHDRHVAIKVLQPDVSATLGADRFLREIQIAARLQHPHIVPLYDSGQANGLLYYVMPYVEGETLRQRIRREKQLAIDDALQISREVADALSYAHSHDLVHRDIKPENVLLSGGHAMVADFGIARAVSAAGGDQLTDSGVAIGTPAYISPEQGTGEADLDGRTDIYALGCVLFEMLAGEPPFTGPTGQAVIARHVSERPPSLRIVRPTVSAEIEEVVDKALAKVPADRFATATQFAEALPVISGPERAVRPLRRRRVPWLAAAVTVVALGTVVFVASRIISRVELDPSRYVIVPFAHRDGAAPTLLNGDQCELRLSQALARWEGITTTDNFELTDAWLRRADTPRTQRGWLNVAKDVGAGKLVWGEVAQFGDTIDLTASVFDVARRGRKLAEARVTLVPDMGNLIAKFEELAVQLLGLERPGDTIRVHSTRSIAAFNAFIEGQNAVETGDFGRAARGFREASELDPNFADAHFWRAQVMAWGGLPPAAWRRSAARAVELREQLSTPSDSALAAPLLALAEGRYVQACQEYHEFVAQDSGNVMAWLGLGDCESRDSIVVRDPGSPSDWSFRGSYHTAVEAYRRALSITRFLTPAFYSRLTSLLPTQVDQFRFGSALAPDTGAFWAFHVIEQDTVAYVPYRQLEMQRARVPMPQDARDQAVAYSREMLRDIVERWARAYPASAEARNVLAITLETFGQLDLALSTISHARELARGREEELRVALTEVRLLVKARDFERARTLADSLLRVSPVPDASFAEPFAALAALTGRASQAAELLAGNPELIRSGFRDAQIRTLPLPLFAARERIRAYAAIGGTPDSLRAWTARFEVLLGSFVGPGRREIVRRELVDDVMFMAYPVLGPSGVHRADATNYLLGMQALLARGDTGAVRARFDTLNALWREQAPGTVAMGGTFQVVVLMLQLGDTADATERLETSLNALPTFSPSMLSDVPDPGALVRSMALRAELAARAGDSATARRWAEPVTILWRDADAELQPLVQQMTSIVAGRNEDD